MKTPEQQALELMRVYKDKAAYYIGLAINAVNRNEKEYWNKVLQIVENSRMKLL